MKLDLQTPRLILRPLSHEDIDISIEMFTDPLVCQFVCDVMCEDEISEAMTKWVKRGAGGRIGIWCITRSGSGEKIGSVFILPMPYHEDDTNYDHVVMDRMPPDKVELGFCLKRSAWGLGYATEASKRLVKFAFEKTSLNQLVASFCEENTPSIRVLEKCGFRDRGRMYCYGQDSPCYRITREEWKAIT
ncbi:MAG: GNAT family N-acetyltransferase [Pseudomonadota bacterium]